MKYKFSHHALEQIIIRKISEDIVVEIINNPESVIKRDDCLYVYQKLVKESNKIYLYRVFINKCKNPFIIVTAYKTSN